MERIEGYVDHIVFRNSDNGYTVMSVVSKGDEVTCVGMLQYIGDGELIEAMGIIQSMLPMAASSR